MKNRAKCKLCESIIESFHDFDHVTCKCGEISVGGDVGGMACASKNWDNFLRVDDLGNIIIPKIIGKDVKPLDIEEKQIEPLTKKELILMIDEMIKDIEKLPDNAMTTPINQYDLMSLLLLLSQIFKAKDE